MFLKLISLRHFRNYAALDLPLSPGLNLLSGDNGQGKTNALEGIVFACTGRSPRATVDAQVIQWSQDHAWARVHLVTQQRGKLEIEVGLPAQGGRRIKVNRAPRARLSDLIGLAPVVQFTVDDLEIIKGEPSYRRGFLDRELSSLSRSYYWHLVRYRKVVDQRNRLLKQMREVSARSGELEGWEGPLVQFGSRLIEKRAMFLQRCRALGEDSYQRVTGQGEKLVIIYRPALGKEEGGADLETVADHEQVEQKFLQALHLRREEEIARGMTLVGPHRDDIIFLLDKIDLRTFGSQGEQRSAAIALRITLASVVAEAIGEPPVLLLDDVLSELDPGRRAALLSALGGMEQMVITCTDLAALPDLRESPVRTFRVAGGRIEETSLS